MIFTLVPEETKNKLLSLAVPSNWQALQAEFIFANLACVARTAIIDLAPYRKMTGAKPAENRPVPHITFQVDCRGLAPIKASQFDAEAFMKNVRDSHTRDILAKLAPHLA